jgi:hypothetical protein
LHAGALIPDGVGRPGKDFKVMEVDWEKVADAIEEVAKILQEAFVR